MDDTEALIDRLRTAVRTFRAAGIDFVLVGGLAMTAHGSSYITRDVDLAYAVAPENFERRAAFLPTIHARVSGRPANDGFVITPTTLARVRFLNLYTDLGEVDVMRELPGIDSFQGLSERAVVMDFGGFSVQVAALDDLIAMQRAAGRPKDQLHLNELLAIKRLTTP